MRLPSVEVVGLRRGDNPLFEVVETDLANTGFSSLYVEECYVFVGLYARHSSLALTPRSTKTTDLHLSPLSSHLSLLTSFGSFISLLIFAT
jgi:hypothetical protein